MAMTVTRAAVITLAKAVKLGQLRQLQISYWELTCNGPIRRILHCLGQIDGPEKEQCDNTPHNVACCMTCNGIHSDHPSKDMTPHDKYEKEVEADSAKFETESSPFWTERRKQYVEGIGHVVY
jgi:hypothetical protein